MLIFHLLIYDNIFQNITHKIKNEKLNYILEK